MDQRTLTRSEPLRRSASCGQFEDRSWSKQCDDVMLQTDENLDSSLPYDIEITQVEPSLSSVELEQRIKVMLESERDCLPRADYVETVQGVGWQVLWRDKVTNWLLEFEDEYQISPETIAISINYMDRVLSKREIRKDLMQLLAIAAVFIATKLHETYPIGIQELSELADGTYTIEDIRCMELEILELTDWKLNPVTPHAIMAHLIQYIDCPVKRNRVEEDAMLYLEVAVADYHFLSFPPSTQATAAVLCAFESTGIVADAWCTFVEPFNLLSHHDMWHCKRRMLQLSQQMLDAPHREEVVSPVGVDELPYDDDVEMDESIVKGFEDHDSCYMRRVESSGSFSDETPGSFAPPVNLVPFSRSSYVQAGVKPVPTYSATGRTNGALWHHANHF